MRVFWTVVHRWVGLLTAGFLLLTGLTGAVISWDHELDDVLNPHLMEARSSSGQPKPALELARLVEARHAQVRVTFFSLEHEPGESFQASVQPRVDPATGRLFEPGFNQIFLDPVSGEELGRRQWGAVWPITSETFVSFLYTLHHTLHLPEIGGIDRWGVWLLGVIAVLWTLDCFIGFYLTLPARRTTRRREADDIAQDAIPVGRSFRQRWKPAWQVRWRGGATRLNFDLHRAFGLWTWGLLFIVAFTGFSLNLYREVFLPMMSSVSKVTPTPFEQRRPTPKHAPIAPKLDFAQMIARASEDAARRGWSEPAGSIFYAQRFGIYGVQFFERGADHGSGGVGHKRLYYDGTDGRYLGDREPWKGSAADIFVQAQFPLHSGRILGLPGRILISVMGLIVALLSVTGVVICMKKRRARAWSTGRREMPARPVVSEGDAWNARA